MTVAALSLVNEPHPARGLSPSRRAVIRWAWRLFRREWRQQLLVLVLIVVAVAVTIVGTAVATNTPPPANSGFGTAGDMATFAGNDVHFAKQLASLRHRFGRVDVIESEELQVPGSTNNFQLRAENPNGSYTRSTLSLLAGRFPHSANEVAVTPSLAANADLKIGDRWQVEGASRRVVGIVENPDGLLDEFALVEPGQVKAPDSITVLFDAPGVSPSSIGPNVSTPASVANHNPINPLTLSLAVLTIGMILIALMSVGGFTVLAQRRLRSLGMLSSVGASDKNVSLVVRANGLIVGVVGAILGVVLGILLWLAYRPHLEQSVHHLIGALALPWLVVAASIVLALLTTYSAATRPAHEITKLSVTATLAGRPPAPKGVHRSALPGIGFLVVAFFLLAYAGSQNPSSSSGTPELVLGLVALFPAVILLAPFFLVGLGHFATHAPVAARIALRDLARYRARSASALAAISLGVMIAVVISTLAFDRYSNIWDPAGPNLASNQANIELGAPNPTAGQVQSWTKVADRAGKALGAQQIAPLYLIGSLQNSAGTKFFNESPAVATPELLRVLGIHASQVKPDADVITSLSGFAGASGVAFGWCEKLVPAGPSASGNVNRNICKKNGLLQHPVIQYLGALPTGVHAPDMLVTEHAVHKLHISSSAIGQPIGWFVDAPQPITSAQISNAQAIAATAGLSIETKNDQPTSGEVVDWATAAGIAIALSILAMSIGLIRSESAGDLRTLAATGASSYTRRTLTAVTAGGLALLGAILGTVTGYVGVIGWMRHNSLNGGLSSLGNLPVANLLAILIGLPLVATVVGWLLGGRQPTTMSHQPIE
jgi:putative ABC transport system permease protein